jgi:hypothetical protein
VGGGGEGARECMRARGLREQGEASVPDLSERKKENESERERGSCDTYIDIDGGRALRTSTDSLQHGKG